jgi:hypothetical protein
MLRSSSGFVSKQVEILIKQINSEDSRFERDLRSVHREKVIIPAEVILSEVESLSAFTRNLSIQGACILSEKEIDRGVKATLKLYRLSQEASSVFAECRWSKPFGRRYWVSGWQFLQVKK